MMNRMLFSNNSNYNGSRMNIAQNQTNNATRNIMTPTSLNAKMIDRVHKVKSGCSACGKRVA
jgi:hypothetical protein